MTVYGQNSGEYQRALRDFRIGLVTVLVHGNGDLAAGGILCPHISPETEVAVLGQIELKGPSKFLLRQTGLEVPATVSILNANSMATGIIYHPADPRVRDYALVVGLEGERSRIDAPGQTRYFGAPLLRAITSDLQSAI